MNALLSLTSSQLNQAAAIKDQIEALNQKLAALLGSAAAPVEASAKVAKGAKGGMSAAGRARIAAAQKARWAKIHSQKAGQAVVKIEKPAKKRKMSAAGRARIIAAQKARWAKVKAEKKA